MSTARDRASPGDIFAALYAAHHAGDYLIQTPAQAAAKGLPGWQGRLACARHAAAVTACKTAALAALHVSGRRVRFRRAALALAADAASHYWADRRSTLAALSDLMDRHGWPGRSAFHQLGVPRGGRDDNPCLGTGAHAIDQAFHVFWLWAASQAAAGKP